MVDKAATTAELQDLHKLLAKSYKTRLQADIDDNVPTDAATLSGLAKFLKDNAITADPADAADLDGLRDKLKVAAAARAKRVGNVIQLVQDDVAQEG